jgi:hypothetical protein
MGTRCKHVECRAERYAQDRPVVFRLRMSAYPWDSTSALLHPHTSLEDTTTSTATTWAGTARRTRVAHHCGQGINNLLFCTPLHQRHTLLPFATFKSRPRTSTGNPRARNFDSAEMVGVSFLHSPPCSSLSPFLPLCLFASSSSFIRPYPPLLSFPFFSPSFVVCSFHSSTE